MARNAPLGSSESVSRCAPRSIPWSRSWPAARVRFLTTSMMCPHRWGNLGPMLMGLTQLPDKVMDAPSLADFCFLIKHGEDFFIQPCILTSCGWRSCIRDYARLCVHCLTWHGDEIEPEACNLRNSKRQTWKLQKDTDADRSQYTTIMATYGKSMHGKARPCLQTSNCFHGAQAVGSSCDPW